MKNDCVVRVRPVGILIGDRDSDRPYKLLGREPFSSRYEYIAHFPEASLPALVYALENDKDLLVTGRIDTSPSSIIILNAELFAGIENIKL